MSDDIIRAPWAPAQVEALNRWQANEWVHPYTCGNRSAEGHKEYAEAHGQRDHGILQATPEGWVCPTCDYTQDTAWAGMLHVEAFDFTETFLDGGRDIVPRQGHERRPEG